eukprot:6312067-Pyramimonas_sp.AAC.1
MSPPVIRRSAAKMYTNPAGYLPNQAPEVWRAVSKRFEKLGIPERLRMQFKGHSEKCAESLTLRVQSGLQDVEPSDEHHAAAT